VVFVVKLADGVATAFAYLATVVIVVLTLHVCVDVGSRYLLNLPLPGTTEMVAKYYMVGAVFLPLAYCQIHRQHFSATLFEAYLPRWLVRRVDGAHDLVMCLLAGLYAYCTGLAAYDATMIGERVQTAFYPLLTWPSRWLVPIGAAVLCVVAALQFIASFAREPE
jgi:TRAP-type C4-dicarboxylate transport system permease small subunit